MEYVCLSGEGRGGCMTVCGCMTFRVHVLTHVRMCAYTYNYTFVHVCREIFMFDCMLA